MPNALHAQTCMSTQAVAMHSRCSRMTSRPTWSSSPCLLQVRLGRLEVRLGIKVMWYLVDNSCILGNRCPKLRRWLQFSFLHNGFAFSALPGPDFCSLLPPRLEAVATDTPDYLCSRPDCCFICKLVDYGLDVTDPIAGCRRFHIRSDIFLLGDRTRGRKTMAREGWFQEAGSGINICLFVCLCFSYLGLHSPFLELVWWKGKPVQITFSKWFPSIWERCVEPKNVGL